MTAPRVDEVRLQVSYKDHAHLDLDVGVPINCGSDTHARINEAVAELIRLLMEAQA